MTTETTHEINRRLAASWALDDQSALRSAARHSQFFAGAAVVIAVLEAFALLLLTPLKTSAIVPVLVDRQTGFVEVLKPDGRTELRADVALTQSLLAQYVIARESFNIDDVAADYRKVALWSEGDARKDYLATMPASDERSPLRRYPRSTLIDTNIKSISPLGRGVLVRFETRRRDADGPSRPPKAWAAVLSYRFSDQPASFEDRLVNPLGFHVTSYHRDLETIQPVEVEHGSTELGPPPSATFLPSIGAPPPPFITASPTSPSASNSYVAPRS